MSIIWTKLVSANAYSTNVGFGIGTGQTLYVVVDSRLRRKYQAEPGRQEWVTALECICADGNVIPPLVIFKGENLLTSWIQSSARPVQSGLSPKVSHRPTRPAQ